MNRRTILKYTALATGAAVGAPLMSVILSGCQSDAAQGLTDNYQPKFFGKEEFGLAKNLVDLILPKTDSPSASEVGVHQIIDNMIGRVYTEQQKEDFKKGFAALMEHLKQAGFQKQKPEGQLKLLQNLDVATDEKSKPARDAFLNFKQQTIAFYLSTEEIGTKYLNYLPVPGKYEPCISLEEAGGKLWAI